MIRPSILIIIRKILEVNFRKQKETIAQYFPTAEHEYVLDLGCGTGEFSEFFGNKSYTGIDIDPANIKYAQKKYRNKKFLAADAKNLPFSQDYFDKILVVGVFHHLSGTDTDQVMTEVKRVLKPSGKILIMEDTKTKSVLTRLIHRLDQGSYIRSEKEWQELFSKNLVTEKFFTFKNGLLYYSTFLLSKKNEF